MSREHPLAPHRVVPVALVALLALVAFAAIKGPVWYQRMYYPLKYADIIGPTARRTGLDPYLVTSVIHAESGFDQNIVSKAGAVGLMQVMPETANDIMPGRKGGGVTAGQLKQPAYNVDIGSRYLVRLEARYHGDTAMALAAYNAGLVNADRWAKAKAGPLGPDVFPETRRYVKKVLADRDTYARLYPGVFR